MIKAEPLSEAKAALKTLEPEFKEIKSLEKNIKMGDCFGMGWTAPGCRSNVQKRLVSMDGAATPGGHFLMDLPGLIIPPFFLIVNETGPCSKENEGQDLPKLGSSLSA
ncbi:MAG TPA: hypothetical protein VHE12_04995 [bacterium]|nr:hypothetical protein [bacterium]